jgi:hypothetical protein
MEPVLSNDAYLDVLLLVGIYQIKHFLIDFILQTPTFFLGKFSANPRVWIPALTVHTLLHAASTYLISSQWMLTQGYTNQAFFISLAAFDMSMHFFMDRLKASPKMWGRFGATSKTQPWFWWALGFDQMIQHFTHYIIILFMVSKTLGHH